MTLALATTAKNEPEAPLNSDGARRRCLAHVISVSGSQAVALLDRDPTSTKNASLGRVEIGALMKIVTPRSSVVGLVTAVSCPIPDQRQDQDELEMVELNLTGEITVDTRTNLMRFRRGVASLPTVGDEVHFASSEDLEVVYSQPNLATIEVGRLFQNPQVPARLLVDDLFGKNFVVVGTTGSGKSSAMSCILQSALQLYQFAHIVILDIHNEYTAAFGEQAELIDPASLSLPFWLMNFEELTQALARDDEHRDAEIEILAEAILASKRRYSDTQAGRLRRPNNSIPITIDTPVPFRLSDVNAHITERLGRLERTQLIIPFRRLKARIESLINDPRFGFMFDSVLIEDTMSKILGRIFRFPVDGRPVTVVNLASVPAEILDIVISVISRLSFDLGVSSQGAMPMLLVCEEAHRYAPAATDGKFKPTRQALARIAKEGRKYGVSLALVTQRPSELDQTILSQCSTIIAMRLANERDQNVVRANTNDSSSEFLEFLPLLGDREAIVLGQGVIMPMRIRFRDIGVTRCAIAQYSSVSSAWKDPPQNQKTLDEIIQYWRHRV